MCRHPPTTAKKKDATKATAPIPPTTELASSETLAIWASLNDGLDETLLSDVMMHDASAQQQQEPQLGDDDIASSRRSLLRLPEIVLTTDPTSVDADPLLGTNGVQGDSGSGEKDRRGGGMDLVDRPTKSPPALSRPHLPLPTFRRETSVAVSPEPSQHDDYSDTSDDNDDSGSDDEQSCVRTSYTDEWVWLYGEQSPHNIIIQNNKSRKDASDQQQRLLIQVKYEESYRRLLKSMKQSDATRAMIRRHVLKYRLERRRLARQEKLQRRRSSFSCSRIPYLSF